VHGKRDDGSVKITIDLKESNRYLSMKIKNKIGHSEQQHEGNGIATENIRERLFTLYDDQYKFKVNQTSGNYSVIMQIPKIRFMTNHITS